MADELLQILPQTIVAGIDENDGETCFTINMKNDNNVYLALQFDLYLPEGVDLVPNDDVPVYLSEDRFTYKRGVCTTHDVRVDKREGFYRVQIYGKNGNVAIPEHEGDLCEIYYTSESLNEGVFPVRLENVVLGISGTEGVEPAKNVSVLYTEDANWPDITSLDLATEGNVVTPDVGTAIRQLMTNPNSLLYVSEGSEMTGDNIIVGGTCANLVLTDGHPFNAPKAFTAGKAAYSREIAADGWYSLCLPFAAETPDGVTVEQLEAVNGTSLDFVAGDIEADKPCIFNAKAGTVELEGSNVAVTATPESLGDGVFVGYYTATEAGDISGYYALRSDGSGFGVADETAYVTPFRAVINNTSGASSLSIKHAGGETAITSPDGVLRDASVYAIDGTKMSGNRLPKGIYISSNNKFVVK